jgi:hypothetical protein
MNNLQVLINGRQATEYQHNNETFIEGREASEFTLRLINPFKYARCKAVVSVDGLSIMDGQQASDESTGYILSNDQAINIKGWRISDDEVRKFFFSNINGSYSAKSGQGTVNTGVIAVKYFIEDTSYNMPRGIPISSGGIPNGWNQVWGGIDGGTGQSPLRGSGISWSTTSGGATLGAVSYNSTSLDSAMPASFEEQGSLGTGMGEKAAAPVNRITFKTKKYASTTNIIYYDTLEGLQRRGIDVKRINYRPNPFPGNYCVEV